MAEVRGSRADGSRVLGPRSSVLARPPSVTRRGATPSTARRDLADVIRRRAAAAPDDVHQAAGGEIADEPCGFVGQLVVLAERVRQAGVGIAAHVALGDAREVGEIRPHVAGAERAVDPDAEWMRVPDGDVERLEGLPRERPAALVRDGERNHHRQADARLREHVLDREDAGLRVERIEDRFEEQHVGATLDEAAHLLFVGLAQRIEGRRAKRRIVHVRRDRQRAVRRSDRAGDEARADPAWTICRTPPGRSAPPRGSARRPAPRARSPPARSTCC